MSSCFEPFRIFVLKTSPAPPRDVCSTTPLAVLHHSLLPRWSALQSRQSTTGTLWAAGSTRSTRIVLFLSLPWVCSLTMTRTSVSNTYYVKCLKHIPYRISSTYYLACNHDYLHRTLCDYLHRTRSRRRPRPVVPHTIFTAHCLDVGQDQP